MNHSGNLLEEESEIRFELTCETIFGEEVYVVGNIEQLGKWDPLKGMRLRTDPDNYPKWYSQDTLTLRKGERFLLEPILEHMLSPLYLPQLLLNAFTFIRLITLVQVRQVDEQRPLEPQSSPSLEPSHSLVPSLS